MLGWLLVEQRRDGKPTTLGAASGAVGLKYRFGFDDSLDVVAVHGIGGLTGLLATGLLATTAVNAAGANGLFYGGGATQLGRQALGALVTIAWSAGLTFAIARVVDKTLGLRAAPARPRAARRGSPFGRLT